MQQLQSISNLLREWIYFFLAVGSAFINSPAEYSHSFCQWKFVFPFHPRITSATRVHLICCAEINYFKTKSLTMKKIIAGLIGAMLLTGNIVLANNALPSKHSNRLKSTFCVACPKTHCNMGSKQTVSSESKTICPSTANCPRSCK